MHDLKLYVASLKAFLEALEKLQNLGLSVTSMEVAGYHLEVGRQSDQRDGDLYFIKRISKVIGTRESIARAGTSVDRTIPSMEVVGYK